MNHRTLGKTGLKVSVLSLGTSAFGGVFGPVDEKQCKASLDLALDSGINLLDTSPFYGQTKSETVLGRCLKGISRDRYFLATKVGRYGMELKDFDFSTARVRRSVDESLRRLGVNFVDIIQCHDIEFGSLDQVIHETIPALHSIVQSGKARFVGITGLPLKIFREVLAQTEVDTILSYCRYTLHDSALEGLLPLLRDKDVGIINAAPFAMGLLTGQPLPAWHPAPTELKDACRRAAEWCRANGRSLAQLALQFALANDRIHTTMIGTADPKLLAENLRWMQAPPDIEAQAKVKEILRPVRDRTWPSGRPGNN